MKHEATSTVHQHPPGDKEYCFHRSAVTSRRMTKLAIVYRLRTLRTDELPLLPNYKYVAKTQLSIAANMQDNRLGRRYVIER